MPSPPPPPSPHPSNATAAAAAAADEQNGDDHHHTLNNNSSRDPLLSPLTSAHSIIRLIQCPRCSLPLRTPLRLPCGNTICKSCLPPIRPRTGITYPADEERKQGFTCYWGDGATGCSGEHCLGDCGTDVLLGRVVDVFEEVLGKGGDDGDDVGAGARLFDVKWERKRLRSEDEAKGTETETDTGTEICVARIGCGDLLGGVYGLVKQGRVGFGDVLEVEGDSTFEEGEGQQLSYERLKEAVRGELDCQVCYSLILDPLTTSCGHTFCRGCVAMVLNHSDLCPLCRRKLNMASTVRAEPVNRRISDLVEALFLEQVVSRREGSSSEDGVAATGDGERTIPLFVSSLSFPTMPTFLHIFEPRYRTMIHRVMQTRDKKFGMVMYNRSGRLQEGLGRAQFMQYGTVLVVERFELLPDGRSLVIASGVSRFKVMSFEMVDGYHVGRIQRVDDIAISEEERLESLETSSGTVESLSAASTPPESLPTQQLFQIALDFIDKSRREGAAWLHPRVLLAYGEAPTDPAVFPWWFACVLPLWEDEKYKLLATTSVRDRLKMVVRWVRKSESREW
ncbi:putative ATP-dependent protease (CrgA) [Aspergillus vadensis CBS 113365]|uniref:ATP-dependent protease n=1 Tax=Aspergillus vadensis (strain CBS 113365 / IMI 142717 / IBT 24658) TaxID=1448311 RepID=A0A319BP49_ASPVC|nr:ATP-dependent protease [Aspergillus vadensis CBS 113365]PYH74455.1 ATP-dependent protease [Aspergillus vadensis CBS 113365]